MSTPGSSSPTTSAPGGSDVVARLTRWADDFPTPGVRFADLTPVFADAEGLRTVVDSLAEAGRDADVVAGIDARGFLLGAGVALALNTGVIAVRKAGKLPPPVHRQSYELEYGTAELEISAEGIALEGRRVLVVDDVLATGGTLEAAAELLTRCGAIVVGAAVVLEVEVLGGRERWKHGPLTTLGVV
ncbi:adenine phosphoribosyltransferase [Rhodococcus sp. BP-349]|jgi:adenine phosphoribosyltransferase|uniref:adenine phosphoribosyltransferase n=1 Tax=unclassified Rhodococcus (in: high G+C Gram-positive bacteria) TaxID=192944 RepID=UPI000488FE71|nr:MULTISPECIES: adenine phosphoribosyltransferase [unclassified Rhodococcus (in: high G+C Gram-positive bacteria)]MBY6541112.1 adenine phosphoribosyltransferase [Rhodococcus sp. BP-363]MBY6544862.1 adenine phosphoribosyltransferase [Rhodococcus sp. BP-369]MBY6564092.1 adenine phosphoribosyltransferase [Rhodococcus sp. BP-370]MBY6578971.1 adenine phosphoribosyltransferase [Rhodococcus sp. BP-364]MBY6588272.1 adenine phosphoribosyltransferase [Rhodococcus sp. BP-358]